MDLNFISQIGLSFFGIIAIILVARKNKWGFVFGLASQPFWILTAYVNKQWGIQILNVIYVFTWLYGIYEWFFKKENNKNK
jgi:nicotinamide riboside transporter PnuC